MNDYHQRFRERFPFVAENKPEAAAAFLAFIDEIVAETRKECGAGYPDPYKEGYIAGMEDTRQALIEKVEGMHKRQMKPVYVWERNIGYNTALDELLTYLRAEGGDSAGA